MLKTFYYNFSRLFGISKQDYLPMKYHNDSFEHKNPPIPDEMLDRILNYVSYKDIVSKTQETLIKMNYK